MVQSKYRPDIDGLRALAVMLVLLFHVGFGFSGGFVGVDVFFVISGFLITGLILRRQQEGGFHLCDFWVRCIHRIIPAATVMVIATLIAGAFLLVPSDFVELAKSAIAEQVMAANLYFWRDTGYFAGPADLKPLLHTWYLGVQVQFYLLYPILLLVLGRFPRRVLPAVLAVGCLGSLAMAEYGVHYHPNAAYFLLPPRAWELVLGGLIWFIPPPTRMRHWQVELLSWLGIGGVLASGWFYSAGTPFPGLTALVPCGGAALLIYANAGRLTLPGRVLALRPIVFVGLISYALYLWHWPILAYARYVLGEELTVQGGLIALAASFVLAVLSWRLVETPLRKVREGEKKWPAIPFGVAGASVAAVVTVAAFIWMDDGIPSRFSSNVLASIENKDWKGQDFVDARPRDGEAKLPLVGGEEGEPTWLVWGDSHAMCMAEVVHLSLRDHGLTALLGVEPGIPPIPGLSYPQHPRGYPEANEHNQKVLKAALSDRIKNVLLIARWSGYVEGASDADLRKAGHTEWDRYLAGDDSDDAAKQLASHGASLVDSLRKAGKRVWVLRQIPELNQYVAPRVLRHTLYGLPLELKKVGYDTHRHRQARMEPFFEEVERLGATVVDPAWTVLDNQRQITMVRDGVALYRDDDHLSRTGAHLLQPVFDKIFSEGSGPGEAGDAIGSAASATATVTLTDPGRRPDGDRDHHENSQRDKPAGEEDQ